MAPRPNLKVLLPASFAAWVVLSFLTVGLAALLLSAASFVPGASGLTTNRVVVTLTEAAAYLVVSFTFFAVVRRLGAPSWYAAAAPVGYLLYVALYFGMTWIAGREMTLQAGELQVLVADTIAVSLGALGGTALRRPKADAGAVDDAAAASAEAEDGPVA